MNRRPGTQSPHFQDHSRRPGASAEVNPWSVHHAEFPCVIPAADAPSFRDRWGEVFGREAPLHLELGSGNGFYLSGMARHHPEINWLGLELRYKRVALCAKKIMEGGPGGAPLPNARVLRYSWFYLPDLLSPGALSGLHLHHPDPWSKEAQARNRIIDPEFCALAASLLRPGAEWRTKTDFAPHIEAIVACTRGLPFEILATSADLSATGPLWEPDVTTNYQRKSVEEGKKIHAIRLRRV